MATSKIEWTELTWNPTTGCNKISKGCKFCYAEVMTKRLNAMGQDKYSKGFELAIHESELVRPYLWKKPSIVFVNSMSDLFHQNVPFDFIQKVFKVMKDNPQHTFQVLTKRAERLEYYSNLLEWPNNVWMGVSVESNEYVNRIESLRNTGAKIKFVSFEPLIGPISKNVNLDGINWAIVGGESGARPRPMNEEWVIDIQNSCTKYNVAFFFKQWGGRNKKAAGRVLNGKTFDEMPV